MSGKLAAEELGGQLGDSWDTLADNCQLDDPLEFSTSTQPQGYELYACGGSHGTVAGIATSDGKYEPSKVSNSAKPVPELVYKMARGYLTKWGTNFQTRSGGGWVKWKFL
jgi:hypothetical protein